MKSTIKQTIIFLLFFGIFFSVHFSGQAQVRRSPMKTRILFIFDESYSMTGNWKTGRKIDIAKKLLIKMVDSLKHIDNLEMALRMYGNKSKMPPQDCNDTHLEVPFSQNNAEQIKRKLEITIPKGTTPIARSLEEAGDDFPPCYNCKNIIILITDGKEECKGDPCKIAIILQNKGITIKPFIIGIGLDVEFKDAFECIGSFYNATNEEQFSEIMKKVVHKSLYGTSAEIDLLNSSGQPKETNVNISLFNQKTGLLFKNFIHTINYKGNPDTIVLPSSITYKMKVHTIPPVIKENITITEGKHNKIIAKTPQGKLNIIQERGLELKGVKCIVRKHGSMKTLYVQDMFEPIKYLTGTYDLEIFTKPRIYYKNIKINQSKTTSIKIKQPGLANIYLPSKGFGGIYKIDKGDVKLIVDLNQITLKSIYLQPGHYIAVYRPAGIKMTSMSKERHFIIKSGRSVNVSLR
ncbi:MAG: von willebrand factor type a [Bacteroidetes bacterium]|nr:MAG: von willebrand factor type a [Bacteroidota bacterium]